MMAWWMRSKILVLLGSLLLAQAGTAQSSGSGSISGYVLSQTGRTLRANVTLSFAEPRGYPALPRRVLTGTNGMFSFMRLPAGRYVLCAQVAAGDTLPAEMPLVDTCVWGSGRTPIGVAAGQQVTGIVLTQPRGALLRLRVVDPDKVLAQAAQEKGPSKLDPAFQLSVKGPDGLHRRLNFVSQDNAGRNYQMVIPVGTALKLKVTSSVGNVYDQGGAQLAARDEVALRANTPADLAPMTLTLRRNQH